MKLTKWDMLILFLILAAALGSFFLFQQPRELVTVSLDGTVVYQAPLSQDYTVTLLDGDCVVEIADGEARIIFSSCPDQTCVHAGPATPTRPVICLPNRVVVSLGKAKEVDAIVG